MNFDFLQLYSQQSGFATSRRASEANIPIEDQIEEKPLNSAFIYRVIIFHFCKLFITVDNYSDINGHTAS